MKKRLLVGKIITVILAFLVMTMLYAKTPVRTLDLQVTESALRNDAVDGLVVCQDDDPSQCHRPSAANILNSIVLVRSKLSLTAIPSANAETCVHYLQINSVARGMPIYTYNVSSGALPAGTSLNTSTGTVSGTPTRAGPFRYTIQVTDQGGETASALSSGTIVASHTVGGTLSGLNNGNTIVLQNNNGDNLTLNVNGKFTFSNRLLNGTSYEVTVYNSDQTCVVADGSGMISGSSVANIRVQCYSRF